MNVLRAIAAAIGIGTTVLLVPGCERATKAEATPGASRPTPNEETRPAEGVEPGIRTLIAAAGEPIIRRLRFRSHLMVDRDVGVMARRDGIIESISAERGQLVREGQELAAMEDDDLVLSEKEAALELERAQASYDRSRRLFEQQILASEEFERIGLRRDSAEKALEKILYELEKCVIEAPFEGIISGRFVEKGQVVREDDYRVLFQVTALGPLLARVYVPEDVLFTLRPQQEAWVIPAAALPSGGAGGDERRIPGRVKWINHVVDAASGTAEVLVEILPGPGTRLLRPGLSVDVRIDLTLGGNGNVVSLPRQAMGLEDPVAGRPLELKVLTEDGSLQNRPIVLGFVGDDRVEIRSGLSAGETIVME